MFNPSGENANPFGFVVWEVMSNLFRYDVVDISHAVERLCSVTWELSVTNNFLPSAENSIESAPLFCTAKVKASSKDSSDTSNADPSVYSNTVSVPSFSKTNIFNPSVEKYTSSGLFVCPLTSPSCPDW